jgi:hypothetical protein
VRIASDAAAKHGLAIGASIRHDVIRIRHHLLISSLARTLVPVG